MSTITQASNNSAVALTLLPVMGVVFVGIIVIGLALPVVPLHVHDGLGYGTFVVGLVAGKVIAWMGTAMFAAFAAGAPIGTALYAAGGFVAVALATTLLPLATLLPTLMLRGPEPTLKGSPSFLSVVHRIWLPGAAAALSSIGFGALITFSALLFSARHWEPVWLAFTAYAVALIVARLLFGHLPDRHGGAKVALVCLFIETVGLALMGFASSVAVAAPSTMSSQTT